MEQWIRSSFCNGAGECAEILQFPNGGVLLRNSGEPIGKALHFTAREWAAFLAGAKAGEFDTPS